MPLSAIVYCIDNSEFSRNGDFYPSRFITQLEVCEFLTKCSIEDNPETEVAIMAAGGGNRVIQSLTRSQADIFHATATISISGTLDAPLTLQVAHLVLKHRKNDKQHLHICLFIASPLPMTADYCKNMEKIAKKFKKSNIGLDIIEFGTQYPDRTEFLASLIEIVNKEDSSHLITIPQIGPNDRPAVDFMKTTPLVTAGAASRALGEDDPELAEALRLSMQDNVSTAQAATQAQSNNLASITPAVAPSTAAPNFAAMTDEEQIQWAIQQSLSDNNPPAETSETPTPETPTETPETSESQATTQTQPEEEEESDGEESDEEESEEDFDEEEMAAALALSMQGTSTTKPKSNDAEEEEEEEPENSPSS